MTTLKRKAPTLQVYPVTPDRWPDFETLFGDRGACGGCWCMMWRLTASQFEERKGSRNKRAMKKIINSGDVPGLLGYIKDEPVAWCSMAPRKVFPRLERSRVLKRIDDEKVWSITCFFVARPYRRQGISVALLEGALLYAPTQGVRILEGYPFAPRKKPQPDAFVWCGLERAFKKAGFKEACRRSPTRPIMRYIINTKRQKRRC